MARHPDWLRSLVEAYVDPTRHTDLPLDNDDPLLGNHREDAIISQVLSLPDHEPEECWRFLQIACELQISDDHLGLMGAGLFEDLMDSHGGQFIERVEQSFRQTRPMRVIVKAAWTMSMTPDVAGRINALQTQDID